MSEQQEGGGDAVEPKQGIQEAIGWIVRAQEGLTHARAGITDAQRSLENGADIAQRADQFVLAAMCATWEEAIQCVGDHVDGVIELLGKLQFETSQIAERVEP